jgi:hypothetical protein
LENEILKYVFTQTIFGGLFVWLLMKTEKRNDDREKRYEERETAYQTIIKELTDKIFVKVDRIESQIESILKDGE